MVPNTSDGRLEPFVRVQIVDWEILHGPESMESYEVSDNNLVVDADE